VSPQSSPDKEYNVSELEHKIQILQHELKDARSKLKLKEEFSGYEKENT